METVKRKVDFGVFSNTTKMLKTLCFLAVILHVTTSRLIFTKPDKRVIIDVDGGIDDYQALTILINADNQLMIKIEAIICTDGNTELKNVENNVLRLLQAADRTDIPVYSGSYEQILPHKEEMPKWYGEDGFADLKYKREPNRYLLKKELAQVAVYNIISRNPGKVSLIVLGPQTNSALGFRIYQKYGEYLKDMHIMGGNFGEDEVEFNFLFDPEAADIVLTTTKCPITMFTWQACAKANFTFGTLFNITGISNPVWNLMEKAERKLFKDNKESIDSQWFACDPVTAAVYLYPEETILSSSQHSLQVKLSEPNRGLTVDDDSRTEKQIKVIEKVDWKFFMTGFIESFKKICTNRICVDQGVIS
ncbi:PREDICTED: uncharacterized protein C1683.06c-like [Nicrophorus vespilloides]|uniref:Uncharacterized protein C1683.06c-like n=1 Tax=Nicrophorus vespilloides TaxID=110193 RepID=A0ABM1MT75_NICVS|nr:PREDICTED: uncharacterized protein C1683.06c-like [Nicrophorus vespilloides]